VRRTSKAPSAGSNSALGRSTNSFIVALLLGTLLAICLIPGSALASEARLQIGSFGPDGTNATQFEYPGAVAVDQGTHDVYVADYGLGTVEKFDQNGAPTDFSALATNKIGGFVLFGGEGLEEIAVNSTTHDFYVADYGNSVIKAFGQDGEPAEFTAGPGAGSNELPEPTELCGVAVDVNGLIYMGDYGTGVHVFKPDGEELTSFAVSSPCNLAVDSTGAVYVNHYLGGIEKFTPSEFPLTAITTYPASGKVIDPESSSGVSVDPSTDDLYVDHSDHVSVYDSSGAPRYEFATEISSSEGVAVDGTTGKAYASNGGGQVVGIFGTPILLPTLTAEEADGITAGAATLHATVNPEGEQLTDCHFEFVPASQFETDQYASLTPAEQAPCEPSAASIPSDSVAHAVKADVSGLAPGTTYHFRLAAETAEGTSNGSDRVFTTAIGAPVISTQSVVSVGLADATLSAKLNPKGAKTTYHLEYGPTASYGQSTPESAPIGFASDDSDHTVSVHIDGLSAATAYHFRFVATSPAGSTAGPDSNFATYPSPTSIGPCANDQFRTGFGVKLPDCRAYEQATPTDKHGGNAQGSTNSTQASSSGDRVTFYLAGGLPSSGGGESLQPYLASRGAGGWTSDGLAPIAKANEQSNFLALSEDLSIALAVAPGPGSAGQALYLRDSDSGVFQLGPQTSEFGNPNVADFAADTSHLIFESAGTPLVPGAVEFQPNLYDLDHGDLTLVSRIPAGSATSCDDANGPTCMPAPEGAFAGPFSWEASTPEFGGATSRYYTENTISRDGSKVFFTSRNAGQLYVREDATATTRISASQRTTPDPNGEKRAIFLAATPDGSTVFFASCEKLTDDSTAVSTAAKGCIGEGQGQDLYSYGTDTGDLTDLTVDSNVGDAAGAAVQGVLGASADGSYVYFVANGVLAAGASSGDCKIGGPFGECNLYVSHNGAVTFVTKTGPLDQDNWQGRDTDGAVQNPKASRVSADGQTLLFSSKRSLTGYDNVEAKPSVRCGGDRCADFELFRYTTPDGLLACISCNPTGAPPEGEGLLGTERIFFHSSLRQTFLTRNLSADGNRVFFDSPDALLSTDTNGVNDVYEWEAKGSGSCESESQGNGCLYLLSSGTSPDPSYFADASVDGDHAFLFTTQQLVPSDKDQLADVYDAGAGAGLASQHMLAPPTCAGAACQANPAPPSVQTPASAAFSGPGNAHKPPAARKCPKGQRKVRRAGRVRCQKEHKQHKRHSNRGGSK
jgi:hypothetical protein